MSWVLKHEGICYFALLYICAFASVGVLYIFYLYANHLDLGLRWGVAFLFNIIITALCFWEFERIMNRLKLLKRIQNDILSSWWTI